MSSTPPSQTTNPLPHPFTLTSPAPTLLTQGAEALLYTTTFLSATAPAILKHRPLKPYRHPILDKRLTRHRILSEARTLVKCRREGVSVPAVLALDAEAGWMVMEFIEGGTVKQGLVRLKVRRANTKEGEEKVKGLMDKIGRAVGRLHEIGVVHGDLTTSNMMIRPLGAGARVLANGDHPPVPAAEPERSDGDGLEGDIVLIDFGLATQSLQDEDKAVDLYVLERAFASTHPEVEEGFQEVLRVYGESYKGAKVVLKRLEEVRMRGRKRSMIG